MPKFFVLLLLGAIQISTFAQSDAARDWKLAVQMWTFNKSTFVDGIAKADSCGFKYIEAYPGQELGGEFKGSIGPSMDAETRRKLKDFLKKHGIVFLAYGVADGADDVKTEKEWKACFEFAKDMQIVEITAMPTPIQLDLVNKLAGAYHIRVAIHGEPGKNLYDHPDSVAKAIRGRPNLGACVDIGNWTRNGVNVLDCINHQLKGRVYSLHLKDIKVSGVVNTPDVVLGQGTINIPGIMESLKKQGFTGFFSIEHESDKPANLNDIKSDMAYFYSQQAKL